MHFVVYMFLIMVAEALLLWWVSTVGSNSDDRLQSCMLALFLAALMLVANAVAVCWHVVSSW